MPLNLPSLEKLALKTKENRERTLFGLKKELLRAASDAELRGELFEVRARIAELFRQYGGERLQEFTELFDSLSSPDDLAPYAIKPKPEKHRPKFKPEIEWPGKGYYVLGDDLNSEQERAMRKKLGGKKRIGSPRLITDPFQLFRKRERRIGGGLSPFQDARPIFVNKELTPEIQKLLAYVLSVRPDIEIYQIRWDGDEPHFELFGDNQLVKVGDQELKFAQQLGKIVNTIPVEGDLYHGRIKRICEFGIFVEIAPGIEGLVHQSEFVDEIGDINPQEGDFVSVEVIEVQSGMRIRLSMRKAQEALEQGGRRHEYDEKLIVGLLGGENRLSVKALTTPEDE